MSYTYEYERPSVTVDIAVFCRFDDEVKLLLILRGREPFRNKWALPGGFIEMNEKLVDSALRELEEETGLKKVTLQQFKTYGDPGRDPRGRTISVVFLGFTVPENSLIYGADDAKEARWFPVKQLPDMAFDHSLIVTELTDKLKNEKTFNYLFQ